MSFDGSRPEACAMPDGRVGLFVGGNYKLMDVATARILLDQFERAVREAESRNAR